MHPEVSPHRPGDGRVAGPHGHGGGQHRSQRERPGPRLRQGGADDGRRALALAGLGEVRAQLADRVAARAALERAVEIWRQHAPADPARLARARFTLATVLPASQRARARSLAIAARQGADADTRKGTDAWLAGHR